MTQRAKQYKHTEIKGLEVEFQEDSQAYKYKNGHALIPKEVVETGKDWEFIKELEPIRVGIEPLGYHIYLSRSITSQEIQSIENLLNKVEPKETPEEKLDREWPPYVEPNKEELTKERVYDLILNCWLGWDYKKVEFAIHVKKFTMALDFKSFKEEDKKWSDENMLRFADYCQGPDTPNYSNAELREVLQKFKSKKGDVRK